MKAILNIIFSTSLIFSPCTFAQKKVEDSEINKEKKTLLSVCSKKIKETKLVILLTVAAKSEIQCKTLGQAKTEAMKKAGFSCEGKENKKDAFDCNIYSYLSYNQHFGSQISYDHLMYTDAEGNPSTFVYINKGSGPICEKDKAALISAGIKDAKCNAREENILKK